MADGRTNVPEAILFKWESNHRLPNTNTCSCVTLDGVADVIRKGGRVERKPVLWILQGGSGGEEPPPDL